MRVAEEMNDTDLFHIVLYNKFLKYSNDTDVNNTSMQHEILSSATFKCNRQGSLIMFLATRKKSKHLIEDVSNVGNGNKFITTRDKHIGTFIVCLIQKIHNILHSTDKIYVQIHEGDCVQMFF